MKRLVPLLAAIFAIGTSHAAEFDLVLNSFGNLSTVAGAGFVDDGNGVNDWNAATMEGGLAINAELSRPHMAAADLTGNLYIADKDADAVRLVTTGGTIVTVAGTNVGGFNGDGFGPDQQLNQPNGLYTFPDGTTFILDLANDRIRRLDTLGNLTTVFQDPAGIGLGRGLWVSADESLIYYASGTEIRRWKPGDGVSTLATGFTQLGNIAVDPFDGNLVATDRGSPVGGHDVRKILPDGSTIRIAGNGTTFGGGNNQDALVTGLNEVRAIWYETTGGYYLGTHRDSQVWYVDTSGIIHLLIDGDRDDDTHGGDGQPLTTPGLKISEPRAVSLTPDRDLLITENDRGYIRLVDRALNVAGDFDYDGLLTAVDMDSLTQVARVGVHPIIFNLNQADSRLVDDEDRRIWVEDLAGTHFGDANLDGLVNQTDFEIWDANKFSIGTGWSTADFNGDGLTDVADFNLWNDNRTSVEAISTVPEPSAMMLVWLACLPLIVRGRG